VSTYDAKALVRRTIQAQNKQDWDDLLETIDDDYVDPRLGVTKQGVVPGLQVFSAAFPDFHVNIEDIFGEGEKVAIRSVLTGTHKGEFAGISATGKRFRVDAMDLFTIKNGKHIEHSGLFDEIAMMRQLGLR
jgi:steroid delta-isomerase-like uncharacterized protein